MKSTFTKFSILTILSSALLFAACEKEEVAAPHETKKSSSVSTSGIYSEASSSEDEVIKVRHDTAKN